jgi:hypothetical protein
MRTLAIALTLGAAVGCTPDSVTFQHESTLYDQTRGLTLQDDTSAQGGMVGNTCEINITNGTIGQDVDVAESDDQVEDAFNGVVLVRGTDGLHLYEPENYGRDWTYNPSVPGSDIVDGAIVDGGVVAVRTDASGITVDWSGDMNASTTIAGGSVDGLSVDRTNGTAYVVSDGTVDAVSADGSVTVDSGDMAVWDSAANILYVADAGGSELRGIEADGGIRFATALDGNVASLGTLNGQAVVSIAIGDEGALVIVDGYTGEIVSQQATPSGADSIETSQSGETLAVVLRNSVHFFRVR